MKNSRDRYLFSASSEGAVAGNDTMTRDIFFINLITFQASVWFLVSSPHG